MNRTICWICFPTSASFILAAQLPMLVPLIGSCFRSGAWFPLQRDRVFFLCASLRLGWTRRRKEKRENREGGLAYAEFGSEGIFRAKFGLRLRGEPRLRTSSSDSKSSGGVEAMIEKLGLFTGACSAQRVFRLRGLPCLHDSHPRAAASVVRAVSPGFVSGTKIVLYYY
jgi:hypothetical protein